jgi:hypothetical protein
VNASVSASMSTVKSRLAPPAARDSRRSGRRGCGRSRPPEARHAPVASVKAEAGGLNARRTTARPATRTLSLQAFRRPLRTPSRSYFFSYPTHSMPPVSGINMAEATALNTSSHRSAAQTVPLTPIQPVNRTATLDHGVRSEVAPESLSSRSALPCRNSSRASVSRPRASRPSSA